ncbi:hypothetical protein KC19_N014100 [Ceratodon purpureus]|nr:hypothetical protein KC19_N014100 [Ceratodon purpureus]
MGHSDGQAQLQLRTELAIMAQPRAGRTLVDLEDAVLRRVLLVSIRPGKEEGHVKSVYLEQLAAELMSEGRPAVLSRDLLERLLMERLGFLYDRSEPPFLYLVKLLPASV